jgi:ABC-2 type transport system ATP-binding protein
MQDEIAIKVENVSKDFVLPHEKITSIKSAFTSVYKKKNKTRETQHALKDISFEVKRGEFFGIVGRNGSGKSTMLKILAGIYQPTNGKMHTNGKLVPFIELGVGFNAELTGRENVFLNGAMLGFSRKEVAAMYDDIVAFAELERFMDQKLKNYSSGMQVRLAFSMATRAEADILLVDEVLAVGDADFQRKCFEYFRTLKRNNKTVVFVSHDMGAIREYCDRAVLIEKSELVVAGTSAKVATEYTKMFTPKVSADGNRKDKKRWGDRTIVQENVAISPKVCDADAKQIEIEVTFKANQQVNDPVFGLLIKNGSGSHLIGNNSKIKQVKTGSFQEGERATVTWTIPNIFNDGEYTIDVAISHSDAITQYDWWEDAAKFTVFKEDRTPYAINPDMSLKLLREK